MNLSNNFKIPPLTNYATHVSSKWLQPRRHAHVVINLVAVPTWCVSLSHSNAIVKNLRRCRPPQSKGCDGTHGTPVSLHLTCALWNMFTLYINFQHWGIQSFIQTVRLARGYNWIFNPSFLPDASIFKWNTPTNQNRNNFHVLTTTQHGKICRSFTK